MIKIAASFVICVVVLVAFWVVSGASREGIPVGWVDVYGDTSGIRRLTVEGVVSSWEGLYGYTFRVNPQESSTEMVVFNDDRAFTNFAFNPFWHIDIPWHPHFFRTVYFPIGDYEIVETESNFILLEGRQERRHPEFRIYGEVFGVGVRLQGRRVLTEELWDSGFRPWDVLDAEKMRNRMRELESRLFVDAGEGGFIFSMFEDEGDFHPGFFRDMRMAMASNTPLTNNLVFDNVQLFVHTGSGLFGETSVYAIPLRDGQVMWLGAVTDDLYTRHVMARSLLPITLARGTDAIRGMIAVEGGFLLLISRGETLEVIRYFMESGETLTTYIEEAARFFDVQAQDNALVFRGDNDRAWTFDLAGEGLVATEPFSFVLGGFDDFPEGTRPFIFIQSSFLRDGVIYFAYTMEHNPWHSMHSRTESFISAFEASTGRLIGRAQLLNGVEDDSFWVSDGGGMRQPFGRRLHSLNIVRG